MNIITTTKDLKALCKKLHKAEYITVDTEFIRERTYWPQLCLIQVAGPKDEAVIDPLAENIDLDPFWQVLLDKNVLKVMHACRQDMEIFFHLIGKVPAPVFDTQVAAMVCGFGEQVGYENLVNTLLKKNLDKSSRFTDWARRPLTQKQLKYALADVTHLRPIYEQLAAQLDEQGRKSWIRDEMKDATARKTYITDFDSCWQRIRIPSNKPRALGILREIAAWREKAAQSIDIPRGRLIKDEALAQIAMHPPKTTKDLAKIRGVSQGLAENTHGKALLDAIARGMALKEDTLPRRKKSTKSRPPGTGAVIDILRVLLKQKCDEHNVAQKLLCNAADLESIAAFGEESDAPALRGWRKRIFGKEALALRNGERALVIQNGQIKVIKA